jgi:hypothetical protein
MTIRTNARVAGVTFITYIVAGIATLAVGGRAHAADVLTVVTSLSALTLGVTLYAITRDQDRDLALLALLCRVVEAVPGHKGGPIFFAVGSTLFCWLLLRGRLIPVALAGLGVIASMLLVALLLVQRAGLFASGSNWSSAATWVVWLPMLVFELSVAGWLIAKGVAAPQRRQTA